MPIYEYRCTACGKVSEVLVKASAEARAMRCEHCGGALERVYLSTIAPLPKTATAEQVPCCGEQPGCSEPKRCCER